MTTSTCPRILLKNLTIVATAAVCLAVLVGGTDASAFHQQMSRRKLAVNEARFEEVVEKLEADVVEYARLMENLYETRCEEIQLKQCANGNYYECFSQYPQEECLSGTSFHVEGCGDEDSGCSGLHDFSISTVRLLSDSYANPDPQVIETVCYTAAMDEWLQAKREADASFWEELGVEPRGWYFGSSTGTFRVWPARHSDQCGAFDPRIRPWYVAASSGPKNVIMILDISGSMKEPRLSLLKEAASRVVSTLTVSDRVAIVTFEEEAYKITDENGLMFVATEGNKQKLLESIDNLEVGGSTNIYDALEAGFDVLDHSAAQEFTVNCNTAILFLTDGEDTKGHSDEELLELLTTRLETTNELLPRDILLFTYSVSEFDDNIDELPRKMACSTDFGVWSKVTDDADIVDSLSSYYQLFALGLGSGKNEDFVAWVEPYQFASGGTWGTSASVPVYDRSKSPPLFLGVVAIDVGLAALDNALGVGSNDGSSSGSQESIDRVALRAVARCPILSLEPCELESFRRLGNAGDEALCSDNCTESDFVQVETQRCPYVSDYPSELFVSPDLEGLSYEERVCCKVGETVPSNECPVDEDNTESPTESPDLGETNNLNPKSSSTGVIVGAAVGGLAGLCLAGYIAFYFSKDRHEKQEEGHRVVVLPPPTAPHL